MFECAVLVCFILSDVIYLVTNNVSGLFGYM